MDIIFIVLLIIIIISLLIIFLYNLNNVHCSSSHTNEYYSDLLSLHKSIKSVDMNNELPEQYMIFKYLDRNSKGVLEFGGNIGRSSIVINKLLKNPDNHVVFESDPKIAVVLKKNRDVNNCKFKIVAAALSDVKLIQNNWATKVDDGRLHKGWKKIPTISYNEFKKKYPYIFDTLVIDCEGCIADILKHHGKDLLLNVNMIIIENDDIMNKHVQQNFIQKYISDSGFQSIDCKSYRKHKCFYQVFKR